jgi:hypothetical protein
MPKLKNKRFSFCYTISHDRTATKERNETMKASAVDLSLYPAIPFDLCLLAWLFWRMLPISTPLFASSSRLRYVGELVLLTAINKNNKIAGRLDSDKEGEKGRIIKEQQISTMERRGRAASVSFRPGCAKEFRSNSE